MDAMWLCCLVLLGNSEPPKRESLKTPTIVFAVAASLDWASTYRNLNSGGSYEANPTLRWANNHPLGTALAGAAIDTAGLWAWNKFVGKRHPKLGKVGLYVAAVFRVFLAGRNTVWYHQKMNARRQQR